MTTPDTKAASAAFALPKKQLTFMDKLRDKDRLRKVAYDLTLWFLVGIFLTEVFARYSPGYPIVVGTASLPTGIYWVDKTSSPTRNDIITFPFNPPQDWVRERYTPVYQTSHTKILKGVPGDVLFADETSNLTLCHREPDLIGPPTCESVGKVRSTDSVGRPMVSWIPPGSQYVLQPGEYWVYAPHPLSLDSRYQGPIPASSVPGKTSPVWLFKIGN